MSAFSKSSVRETRYRHSRTTWLPLGDLALSSRKRSSARAFGALTVSMWSRSSRASCSRYGPGDCLDREQSVQVSPAGIAGDDDDVPFDSLLLDPLERRMKNSPCPEAAEDALFAEL